jgi:hypothetical protein
MIHKKYLQNALIGGVAVLFGGTRMLPSHDANGPIASKAIEIMTRGPIVMTDTSALPPSTPAAGASKVAAAVSAFTGAVTHLSDSHGLQDAFKSYFAFKAAHPDQVKKPLLYFVDYGLPSTTPRGYVFDMESMKVVDGPFMVAHGRGSSTARYGLPTRFSNASGSAATSLGLYVAQELYRFTGHTAGQAYASVGLRLQGVSGSWNSNARARGVVAHGAPYVTPTKAGRSEGCPAMEQQRAQKLLPELANGGLVFLYAPNDKWEQTDPWVTSATE